MIQTENKVSLRFFTFSGSKLALKARGSHCVTLNYYAGKYRSNHTLSIYSDFHAGANGSTTILILIVGHETVFSTSLLLEYR